VLRALSHILFLLVAWASVALLALILLAFNRDHLYIRTDATGHGRAVHLTRATLRYYAADNWPNDGPVSVSGPPGAKLYASCVDPLDPTPPHHEPVFFERTAGVVVLEYYRRESDHQFHYWRTGNDRVYQRGAERYAGSGHSLHVRLVPTFALALVVLAAFWPVARAIQRFDRRRRGLCPMCGYDVRATPARCPECGVRSNS
jgi:hypothetical protein